MGEIVDLSAFLVERHAELASSAPRYSSDERVTIVIGRKKAIKIRVAILKVWPNQVEIVFVIGFENGRIGGVRRLVQRLEGPPLILAL